ncbi:hypothetical protein [Streptomyces griseorubiginosus]|uniref:hypothetical protein n=1 Tax=Streptomyces griseorubiginosus TaxID=67304 RepID=UPI001AD74801|nr:hypothetical protein [Streptomyces griseorubiginosus]MBO4259261.1 hypothetical protein [Streptomyces griseorubiginosus]
MLIIQLVVSVAAMLLNHIVQTRYGLVAGLGLVLLGVGARTRNDKCAGAGAALLALAVMAGPA